MITITDLQTALVDLLEKITDRKHSDEFLRKLEKRFPKPQKMEKELLEYWFLVREQEK